jgi:hypothetical protein
MRKVTLALMAATAFAAALPAQAQYGKPQYPTQYPSQGQYPQSQPQYPSQGQYAQPQPQYGPQPSGSPLSSIFGCQASGSKQGTGAVVGAIAGAVIGAQLSDKHKGSATAIGAALGAATGSYVGCQMQVADQQRAQASLQAALDQGRSQQWDNPQTGASGRYDVIDTYNYGQQGQGQRGQGQQGGRGQYAPPYQPVTINTVAYNPGIEVPREYQASAGQYQANGPVNIRSGPSERAKIIASLRTGETVDGMVRVEGSPWVLAIRDNVAVGYFSETTARLVSPTPLYAQAPQGYGQGYGQNQGYDPRRGSTCRTVDQTFTAKGGQAQTQRVQACQTAQGWQVI